MEDGCPLSRACSHLVQKVLQLFEKQRRVEVSKETPSVRNNDQNSLITADKTFIDAYALETA